MRYKCLRSVRNEQGSLHIVFVEDAFDQLPNLIRHLGPWQGSSEGEIDRLKLHYRLMLAEQRFVIIHGRLTDLKLESAERR